MAATTNALHRRLDHTGAPIPQRPGARPQPWLAATSSDGAPRAGWDPWAFDDERGERMHQDDLCQVCGAPRVDVVYVLAPANQTSTLIEMYGGAVCSLKCAPDRGRVPALQHRRLTDPDLRRPPPRTR